MKDNKNMFSFGVMMGLFLVIAGCGADTSQQDASGQNVTADGDLSCISDNDCDGDGIDSPCDADDGDGVISEILPECDEDGDGFVDTPCTSYEDTDGDGFFTDIDREEIGFNCDVCPELNDPGQEDSDADGVGDMCAIAADVGVGASPPQ